jgi:hypothetical protein
LNSEQGGISLEAKMNHSNTPVEDGSFPLLFVLLSTFVGVLIWLYVMLNSLPPH